jgi:hypothetical protein
MNHTRLTAVTLEEVLQDLEHHLADLTSALDAEIDLHGGRTEMARNLRLNIIETELELEGLK